MLFFFCQIYIKPIFCYFLSSTCLISSMQNNDWSKWAVNKLHRCLLDAGNLLLEVNDLQVFYLVSHFVLRSLLRVEIQIIMLMIISVYVCVPDKWLLVFHCQPLNNIHKKDWQVVQNFRISQIKQNHCFSTFWI